MLTRAVTFWQGGAHQREFVSSGGYVNGRLLLKAFEKPNERTCWNSDSVSRFFLSFHNALPVSIVVTARSCEATKAAGTAESIVGVCKSRQSKVQCEDGMSTVRDRKVWRGRTPGPTAPSLPIRSSKLCEHTWNQEHM
jgi:hypothetical protein